MDSNPICHPSTAKKKNEMLVFLDYVHLLMISRAGQWTWIPSATPLQPKKRNAHFWITFSFWWLVGLVYGLKLHPPPFSSLKNKMLIFGLCSTSDDWLGWSMDSNPICHPSPAKKIKCSFLDYVQLLMISRAVDGLKPHLPPLSSQKNKMLIFGLHSTSDDRPGWLMDSNPICHPSPAKKNKMLIFGLHSTSDDWLGWSKDSNPICHPLSSQKNEMLIFGLYSTSDDWPGWLMDSNPICHPSPAKKMKCLFFDYVHLLMIGWTGQWTWIPFTTPLQPKNEMLIFGLRSTSDD